MERHEAATAGRLRLRSRPLRPVVAGLIALALALLYYRAQHRAPAVPPPIVGQTMGTTYTVKLGRLPGGVAPADVEADVRRALDQIDRLMSTYNADSELSRWNRSASTDWEPVSPETARVVAEALRLGELTGGALDVTVGPLVELWHFGPGRPVDAVHDDSSPAPPDAAALAAALGRVDYRLVEARLDPPALRKALPEVEVDLSAIAKGFGVDRVAECLERRGLKDYLVEVGGEVRARGRAPQGRRWHIGVESPVGGLRPEVQRVVALDGMALATSGDYRNYFEREGRRYSHIIDPRTGKPVEHRLASVTVLDPSCMTADGLATALMVLGPEEAFALAERLGLSVLLIVRTDAGFEERTTGSFAEHLVE